MIHRPCCRNIAASYNILWAPSCRVLLTTKSTLPSLQPQFQSRIASQSIAFARYASTAQSSQRAAKKPPQTSTLRYAQPSSLNSNQSPVVTVASLRESLNPPPTTLPPILHAVERGPSQSTVSYYFQLGRSYASFYKTGVKNTWANYKAANAVRKRIRGDRSQVLTRSEYILLRRSSHDVKRVPFFAILFILAGEWLPLIVPFMPRLIPLTCRIPKQEDGMRKSQLALRRPALQALGSPNWQDTLGDTLRAPSQIPSRSILPMCQIFGLYSPKFHWLINGLPVLSQILLRGRVIRHLTFLKRDDRELLEMAEKVGAVEKLVSALSTEERIKACEDRGLDVFEKQQDGVRGMLVHYLTNLH